LCDSNDPLAVIQKTRANCLLRGIPGTYTRFSTEANWRRTFIDSYGQMFTPFAFVRADLGAISVNADPGVGAFIGTGESSRARVMPGVGLEYRYPFISAHSWGSQTIEPIAQVIFRPDETQIGKFPNEDAQSLLFDDANLFQVSKYSGWDRVEGGGRANVGLQYTAQFNRGGYFNALVGQSYRLFGQNSYAVADMANTGIDSGLETDRSDYVARTIFQPNKTFAFISRWRLDEQEFSVRRMEFEARANFDRWLTSVTYGNYDAQPSAGLLLPREAIMPSVTLKLTPNWSVSGSALYSIDSSRLATATMSLGYVDECIAISAIFQSNYGYRGDVVPNQVFMLQIALRTLGGTTFSQTLGGPGNSNTGFWNPGGF
jgi:LPS-assembly protein